MASFLSPSMLRYLHVQPMLPTQLALARPSHLVVLTGAYFIACGQARARAGGGLLRVFSSGPDRAASEDDLTKARQWYKQFSHDASQVIPRTLGEVSYSRSSGPGGQNVNKVNSKAQLRVPVAQLLGLLPSALHPMIRQSRYYADNTDSLLIQANESRKAGVNKDTCYRKLSELIGEVYQTTVPGETSPEQKEKVKQLKRSENEARLKSKKKLSSKKAGRSSTSGD